MPWKNSKKVNKKIKKKKKKKISHTKRLGTHDTHGGRKGDRDRERERSRTRWVWEGATRSFYRRGQISYNRANLGAFYLFIYLFLYANYSLVFISIQIQIHIFGMNWYFNTLGLFGISLSTVYLLGADSFFLLHYTRF
jgi:hypothetical protein